MCKSMESTLPDIRYPAGYLDNKTGYHVQPCTSLQCCGSVSFLYGSGSGFSDAFREIMDLEPDPAPKLT